jgi:hypothetical protein
MISRWCALMTPLSLALTTLMWGGSAQAQCRLCSVPTTSPEPSAPGDSPIRLEVVSTINFDRLLFTGNGMGTAILRPDGTNSSVGAIAPLSPRAIAGEIVIRGEPGRSVSVDLPHSIELYGLKGGSISIDSIASDLPVLPTLDASGMLRIRIGGELKVSGDVDGDFRGDVPVIVDYL